MKPLQPLEPARARRGPLAAALLVALLALPLGGCVPWKAYPVSPRIDGRLAGTRTDAVRMALEVRNQRNEGLAVRTTVELDADGRFHLDPQTLVLGGREIYPRYVALLRLEDRSGEAVIVWRSEWFRQDFERRVLLECEFDRPDGFGQVCRVAAAAAQPWLVQNGQLQFQRVCSRCHGIEANGEGVAAHGLSTPPPDLTRIAARRGGVFEHDEIYAWIDGRRRTAAHGLGDMPVWGFALGETTSPDSHHLTTARLDAIVAYLEHVQRPAEETSATR